MSPEFVLPGGAFATTVVIPVRNGGEVLERCLAAVVAQKTSFPVEVLCIDSGSTDGSLETIERSGARLYQIAPETFGHGRTRNLGVSLSQTPFVALITQDAVPADDEWLEQLIRPFRYDDTLAGVFGRHLPHEGCRRAERYMLERHFAAFGSETMTWRIGHNPKTWSEYAAGKDFFAFFSDNNAALRKSVWELIPYADVEFMEDQLWAAAVLEAGYGKAWAPRASVRHSHNYDTVTTLRRAFDESRFRRLYKDPPNVWSLGKWMEHARLSARRDLHRLERLSAREYLAEAPGTVTRHYADAVGRFLGDSSPLLPKALVQRLSQHASLRVGAEVQWGNPLSEDVVRFVKDTYAVKGSIDGTAEMMHQVVHLARTSRTSNLAEALLGWRRRAIKPPALEGWWKADVYRFLGSEAKPLLKDRRTIQNEALTLNWVVPPFGEGGGGHLNIFRMIHLLEKRGLHSRVYVLNGREAMPYPRAQLRSLVHEWFAPIEAPVEPLTDALLPADFSIATHWTTAYAVRALGNSLHQGYFVQDYEPMFYPAGAEAVFADQTYRMGFLGLAAGAWLGQLLHERFGMTAKTFKLAVDHEVYWPEPPLEHAQRSIFAYVRPHTPRRAFELVALALANVKKLRPQVSIHVAGAQLAPRSMPFEYTAHGILNSTELRRLYSRVSFGVAASLTNYSLLPQEMAACGCPVIDLDGETTRAVYPPGAVVLAEPTVEGLTKEMLALLDDDVYRRQQAQRGLDYAAALTWDDSADAVKAALEGWSGRAKVAPARAKKPARAARAEEAP